jgi:hypothetical protein
VITAFESPLRGEKYFRALGLHTMDAIEQIRARGLEAAIEAMATVGGVVRERDRPRMARELLKQIQRTPSSSFEPWRVVDVPLRSLADGASEVERIIHIPVLSWSVLGFDRQIGRVRWYLVSRTVEQVAASPPSRGEH